MKLVKQKGKIINLSEKQKNKKAEVEKKKALDSIDCLKKLQNTILLNYNCGSLKFGKDEYDHIDCESLEEFVKCYDTIFKVLTGRE